MYSPALTYTLYTCFTWYIYAYTVSLSSGDMPVLFTTDGIN